MHLELNDEKVLEREFVQHRSNDRYPPQSPHCGTEGDPETAKAGARTRTPVPATALQAAEQGRYSRRSRSVLLPQTTDASRSTRVARVDRRSTSRIN
jgi:hypothetical protein